MLYLDSTRLDEVHLPCHLASPHDEIILKVHLQEWATLPGHTSQMSQEPLLHVTALHQNAESSTAEPAVCIMSSKAAAVPSHLLAGRKTAGASMLWQRALQVCCAARGMLTVGLSWVTREVTKPGSASSKKGTQATRSWQMCRHTCTAGQGRAQDRSVKAAREGLPALHGNTSYKGKGLLQAGQGCPGCSSTPRSVQVTPSMHAGPGRE